MGRRDARDVTCGVDDGRFDADLARAAVQFEVGSIAELGTDIVRRRGAD
jgi:hypothetical protein